MMRLRRRGMRRMAKETMCKMFRRKRLHLVGLADQGMRIWHKQPRPRGFPPKKDAEGAVDSDILGPSTSIPSHQRGVDAEIKQELSIKFCSF